MCFVKIFVFIILISFLIFMSGCKTVYEIQGSDNNQVLEPEYQQTGTDLDLGTIQIREIDRMTMVYVPGGQFEMGSNEEILCPYASPAHIVSLDAFWIDQVEVTNSMFTFFLNEQGNQTQNGITWFEPGAGHQGVVYGYIAENEGNFFTREGYERYPVIEVSWYGAAAYCSWIGGRLPTEAEWEYAARGPNANQYPWGNSFNGEVVNYCDGYCQESWRDDSYKDGAMLWTAVGNYPEGASWCGAFDLAGNVWEWVNDWWSDDYYAYSPIDNPEGPLDGTLRIARGGSWYDEWWRMSSSCRKGLQPSSARMHWVGFRCVIPGE